MPIRDVADRAVAYGMPGAIVANDVLKIHEAAGKAIERARNGGGPTLLEVKSSRWHGHFVGDAQKYRPEENVEAARKRDCILNFQKRLLKDKVLRAQDPKRVGGKIQKEIEEAVTFARESPLPDDSELLDDLYAYRRSETPCVTFFQEARVGSVHQTNFVPGSRIPGSGKRRKRWVRRLTIRDEKGFPDGRRPALGEHNERHSIHLGH
jgi:hypothetical protein